MIVVDTPIEVAVERLVAQRGHAPRTTSGPASASRSRARSASPGPTSSIDNGGDLAAARAQVDALWAWIQALPGSRH